MIVIVQPLLAPRQLDLVIEMEIQALDVRELISIEDDFVYITESDVHSRESNIYLDYDYESPTPTHSRTSKSDIRFEMIIIMRIFNRKRAELRPINLSSPLRGELEIVAFGRQALVDKFRPGNTISLLYFLFIDGFGLYKNMYRSLMGIYMPFTSLNSTERNRRANVFPLTLGPHGSNLNNVMDTLHGIRDLDRGMTMTIDGEEKTVCAYIMAYLGDMPQQNENAGFKKHIADRGCRTCLITSKERHQLSFDVVKNGRYHFQMMHLRKYAESLNKIRKAQFCKKWRMKESPAMLTRITFALDLIKSCPADVAHSEFTGMAKQAQALLVEAILNPAGQKKYVSKLHRFPFPAGWGRLQSPLYHLQS